MVTNVTLFSDVTGSNKEVLKDASVTLSCSIVGVSGTASVTWKKTGKANLSGESGYTVEVGTWFNGDQVSTLAVDSAQGDTTYTCDVAAPGPTSPAQSTEVTANVFGN